MGRRVAPGADYRYFQRDHPEEAGRGFTALVEVRQYRSLAVAAQNRRFYLHSVFRAATARERSSDELGLTLKSAACYLEIGNYCDLLHRAVNPARSTCVPRR